MKTLKAIALILIMGIASYGFAQTETPAEQAPDPDPQTVVIQFRSAMQNPGLVRAMHGQLNPRFLLVERPRYTVPVYYQRKKVYVTGTYTEWKGFFRIDRSENGFDALKPTIPLRNAMKNPHLVLAMRAQLNSSMLQPDKQTYVAPVRFKHSIVYVTGSLEDWKWFFRIKKKVAPQG